MEGSLSSGERGLKSNSGEVIAFAKVSLSSGERGLKFLPPVQTPVPYIKSLSSGERGLKYLTLSVTN